PTHPARSLRNVSAWWKAGWQVSVRTGPLIAEEALVPAARTTAHTHNGSAEILQGDRVQLVSPAALARWREIVLLEDDSARAARLGAVGVSDRTSRVLMQVHRIGRPGVRVAAGREYVPGRPSAAAARQRFDLALELLDQVSCVGSVVVCGPTYGANTRFL